MILVAFKFCQPFHYCSEDFAMNSEALHHSPVAQVKLPTKKTDNILLTKNQSTNMKFNAKSACLVEERKTDAENVKL